MKLLCSSSSLAFIQSIRIALDGEGIETFCSDADSTLGTIAGGPMAGSSARIYVLHEEDWTRAVEIMEDLAGPSEPRPTSTVQKAPLPAWLIIGLSAVLVALVGGILSN